MSNLAGADGPAGGAVGLGGVPAADCRLHHGNQPDHLARHMECRERRRRWRSSPSSPLLCGNLLEQEYSTVCACVGWAKDSTCLKLMFFFSVLLVLLVVWIGTLSYIWLPGIIPDFLNLRSKSSSSKGE